tara:strand:- start:305 stop:625 length:321 start_codon:yes stop_codon:yes gene_type:complete
MTKSLNSSKSVERARKTRSKYNGYIGALSAQKALHGRSKKDQTVVVRVDPETAKILFERAKAKPYVLSPKEHPEQSVTVKLAPKKRGLVGTTKLRRPSSNKVELSE